MQDLSLERLPLSTEVTQPWDQETEEISLRDYWKVLVRHRLLVVLVFLTAVGLMAGVTFFTTPLYTAGATLKIDPQNPTVVKIDEVMAQGEGADYYQTQLVLLKGRTLAARVVTELGLEQNPAFTGARQGQPSLFDWLRSQLSSLLQFTRTQDEESVETRESESRVPPEIINRYLSLLEIALVRGTRLVEIKFTTSDPRLSRDMANAHATAFIRLNLETRFELTQEAGDFLEKKLSDLKARLEQSEEDLNRFRQAHGVVSMEGSENIIVERMVDLNRRLTETRAKRIELESLYRIVESKNYHYLSEVINDVTIQGLKSQVATLEAERTRLALSFKPTFPHLMELDEQIKEAHQRLDHEIDTIVRRIQSDYMSARAREEALQAEAERQQQVALNLKERGAEYLILEGAVKGNRALYDSVLNRANETNVSGDITLSNIQITDRAETPLAPSSPRKGLNFLMATVLGLFFGVSLAFLLEFLDSTIKTSEDVWRAIFVPTLGMVPHLQSLRHKAYGYGHLSEYSPTRQLANGKAAESSLSKELMVLHHPFSVISESYHNICTTLLLSKAEKPPQVILLTSALPNEGKSVTALNLGLVLAQGERTVLVIDADLRKGRCHEMLGMQNHNGLTNVLVGSLTLEEGVQPTMVKGLFLLSRGVFPPNPVELLRSQKMKEVIDTLRQRFDFILIDSSPVIGLSDARVLCTMCDGTLFVVRGQQTTTTAARHAMEQLRMVNAQILGAVLNGIDIRAADYADYHYSYMAYYSAERKTEEQQS